MDPLLVVVIGAQQVVSEPGYAWDSEDSKGSRSDQVEIVCRSQVRGIGVQGDRVSISGGLKVGSLDPWWSRSGEKLDLGFQEAGKNLIFI